MDTEEMDWRADWSAGGVKIESSGLGTLILSKKLTINVEISNRQLHLEFREAVKAQDIFLGTVNKCMVLKPWD